MTQSNDKAANSSTASIQEKLVRFAIDDKINAAYYGELGEAFARKTRERVHWVAAQSVGNRILDVGCSQGIGCILLGREGCEVLGVDISPSAIEHANRYLATETETVKERVKFVSADFMACDFGNRKFTTVVLGEVLEHLTRPGEFVARAFDLLEPSGRLVVTVPFGINDFPDHKQTYYLTGILSLLNGLFDLREVRYFGQWIGFCADRLAERVEPMPLSLTLAQVDALEQSFLHCERKLRDEIANTVLRMKTVQEQSATNRSRAESAEQKFTEANRLLIDKEKVINEADGVIATLRREAEQARAALEIAKAEAARGNAELETALRALAGARAESQALESARSAAQKRLEHTESQKSVLENQVKELASKLSQTERRVGDLERERSLILGSTSMKAGRLLVESYRSPGAILRMPRRLWGVYREANARRSGARVQNSNEGDSKVRISGTPVELRPASTLRNTALALSGQVSRARSLESRDRLALPAQCLIPDQSISIPDYPLNGRAGTVELVLNRAEGAQGSFALKLSELTGKGKGKLSSTRMRTIEIPAGSYPQAVLALPVTDDVRALSLTLVPGNAPVDLGSHIGVSFFPRGVSVVIPAFKAVGRIIDCLDSLASQTLSRDAFEVIVVVNGPEDGTESAVKSFGRANQDLKLRVMRSSPASAGGARNVGIAAASFDHVTLLDDDDTVTPGYLAALLAEADGDTVVIASIRDVLEGEARSTPLSTQIETAAGQGVVPFALLPSLYTMNACKLVPTSTIRRFAFDPTLRSGEDVVFWAQLATTMLPGNRFVRDPDNALYLRALTHGSVSRRDSSYAFMVTERIAVMAGLVRLQASADCRFPGFADSQMRSQAKFIQRYLEQHLEDYPRAVDDITAAGLPEWVTTELNAALTDELVLSFCFPPANDTAGIVAAKRIAMGERPVDVLSNQMVKVRQKDPSLSRLTQTRIGRHIETDAPEVFSNWNAIEAFCRKSRAAIDTLVAKRGRPYATLYSRAMWPASHFAAAYQKARQPDLKWLAEFSDPLLRDVKGHERGAFIDRQWLSRSGLLDRLEAQGLADIAHDNLFAWCEVLPIALANTLIFTNQNQLDYMLGYQADDRLRNLMRQKAVIAPQPTLPADYYKLVEPSYSVVPDVINIAYFGSFYQNRGVGELLTALGRLPDKERARLCLHIFTQEPAQVTHMPDTIALGGSVRVQGYLNYLEFLSTSTLFDYLYVNDAQCSHHHGLNPYLPSKLSDYLGAGRRILASLEPGSPMSRTVLPEGSITVILEDQDAMVAALQQIIRAGKD
jgi:2-polyprenyl-3-methyl-5-hydroxy-6-metoxy-1,4-benzoquinol methylase